MNRELPRTGGAKIHLDDLHFIVEKDEPIIELKPPVIGNIEKMIGEHVASLITDGATLQLGIGAIPDAVLLFFKDKKDLGIHSEMFSDGVVALAEAGVITNQRKTINKGKFMAAFLMGTRKLFDKNAVEAALQLKEKHGGKVTVITMGPPQAKEALKECLAMGADEAYHVSDRLFGGADTLATSYTLATAIRKLGKFDIILCGKQAIDGDTAQVGPEIAEYLNMAQITYAAKVEVNGDTVRVEREHEEGYEIIEAKLPVLLTVVKSINEPRFPTVRGTMKANRKEIPVIAVSDLDVDPNRIGLKGSPTQVQKIFTPQQRTQGEIIQADSAREAVQALFTKLSDAKISNGCA